MEEPVHPVFNCHLQTSFLCIPLLVTVFKAPIVEAAVKCCCQKVTGACLRAVDNFRTCWWTPEVKEVVNLKKEAPQTWLWPRLLWKQKQRCGRNLGTILAEWRTGLVVSIFKKEDRSAPIRGVLLPGKSYSMVLEMRLGRVTLDQLFTFSCLFGAAWQFSIPVYMCFVDREDTYDWFPRGFVGDAAGIWGSWPVVVGHLIPV